MSLSYRLINPANYDEVYRFNLLHEFSFRDSSDQYIADTEEQREKKTRSIIEKLKDGENKYYCMAAFDQSDRKDHGDQSEMIAAIFQARFEIDNQPACHIHGLWVHPDYRGKGIASKLKRDGEIWAKQMDCKFMDTNVRVTNKPIK